MEKEHMGPFPFRFNPLWLEDKRIVEIIQRKWANYVEGSPSFVLETKLKMVKKSFEILAKRSIC